MAHSVRGDAPELPDFSLLKRLARDQLIYLLEQLPGRKDLFIEADLMSPLDRIANVTTLKQHDVDKLYKVEYKPIVSTSDQLCFLIRPRIQTVKWICDVTTDEWSFYLLPLDDDIISLELPEFFRDNFLEGDQRWVRTAGSALHLLHSVYGPFSKVYGIGRCSKMAYESWREQVEEGEQRARQAEIGNVFLIDRDVDLVTPLCSQVVYEGLVDDIFRIKCGCVEFGPEVTSSEKSIKVMLNSQDKVFNEIRNEHFSQKRSGMDIKQMKTFVSEELKGLKQEHRLLSLPLLEGFEIRECISYIEEHINRQVSMLESMRLLCLLSLTENGLLPKDYRSLKAQFLQSYGADHLLTFSNLKQLGLLVEQQPGETLTVMESRVGKLVNDKTAGKLTDAFSSLAKKSNFRALSRRLNLVPKSDEEYDLRVPRDMAYIFSGAYIPLSCKLIEQVLERDGWTGLEEVTRMLNGHEFAVTGSNGSDARVKTDSQRIILVMFLGGCTFSEISALRFLGREKAESVACLNKALCHLKDIWEEIGIPEDQRLQRTNVVKNHIKGLLDMMITEEESLRTRLLSSIEACRKQLDKLCLELQLPPFEVEGLVKERTQRMQQLKALTERDQDLCDTLCSEPYALDPNAERRHAEFVGIKRQIILCMDDLDQLPETSFEKDIVCEDQEAFCLSKDNIASLKLLLGQLEERKAENQAVCEAHREKIQELWDRLQLEAEGRRLVELKLLNMRNVTEAIRSEIAVLWEKCFFSSDQRQAFVPYYSDDFTEELLGLHDAEILRLKQHYEEHKELGGNLLKEEKQKAELHKSLPKLEKKLKAQIDVWEQEQAREFLVNGQKFMQFVEEQWELHRIEKENEKLERQLKKSKQIEVDMLYGTAVRTPTKRRFLGTATPTKARKLNGTTSSLSSANSNSTIRSAYGGTVPSVRTPGRGKPPLAGLPERNKENMGQVTGLGVPLQSGGFKTLASPQRNFSINSVASTYSEFA
ncbi:unnamed protein product, partial [Coregonus sp. 'balchen']